MRLRELEATFLRHSVEDGRDCDTFIGDTLHASEGMADGVMFLCPKCFATNGGPVGTHMVVCYFVGRVPPELEPGPGRWNPEGTSIDDLTFVPPGATSVLLTSGCCWHGFVNDGSAA